jgi:hypothetical protein
MTNTNFKDWGGYEYDAKEFKRAWTHWYVQLGKICDTKEDFDLYRQVEAFVLSKIKETEDKELSQSATQP